MKTAVLYFPVFTPGLTSQTVKAFSDPWSVEVLFCDDAGFAFVQKNI